MEFSCRDLVDKSACGMPKLSDEDDRAVCCERDHRRGTGVTHHFQLDRDEVLEVVEVTLEEAIRMIRAGTIRDAKTIVGLQLVFAESRK